MKNQITLFFLFLSIAAFSQSTESLKVATAKLYEANYLMDFDVLVYLAYPKLTESKTEKDTTLDELDLAYQNGDYRMRLQLEKVSFQFGTIKKLDAKSFCIITFRNPIRYFFETKLTDKTVAETKAWLQEINHTKDVIFEPGRNSFNVKKTTTYVAVMDDNTNKEWKFFNFDISTQQQLFKILFPKNIQKALGL
ncbi:MAG: hypothetical protein ABIQ27_03630 [Flavobacterium sp.]|uniref:hypothetical protein n=1 Tax=Flavobacterium sp. TaxID=239 RepID=UPI0032647138